MRYKFSAWNRPMWNYACALIGQDAQGCLWLADLKCLKSLGRSRFIAQWRLLLSHSPAKCWPVEFCWPISIIISANYASHFSQFLIPLEERGKKIKFLKRKRGKFEEFFYLKGTPKSSKKTHNFWPCKQFSLHFYALIFSDIKFGNFFSVFSIFFPKKVFF